MAKLTKKIRISEYDVVNDQFNLTFQLGGYADHLSFEALVADNSVLYIDGDSDDILVGLGFSNGDIHQMINELVQWVEEPRKQLNNNSHMYTMRSRFEVTERLEAERGGKAAVERIAVEAPCLDWAMSVTEELVDKPTVVGGADVQASNEGSVETHTFTAPNGANVTQIYNKGVLTDEMSDIVDLKVLDRNGVRRKWSAGTVFSTPVFDGNPEAKALNDLLSEPAECSTDKAAQQSVEAIRHRITTMEVAGLGEAPGRIDINIVENRPGLQDTPTPSEPLAPLNRGIRSEVCAEFGLGPAKLPAVAIDKAINAIHTHARRFLTPMSLREHDFLRSIIQEEIVKVVGGIL